MAVITGWVSAIVHQAEGFSIFAFAIEDTEPPTGDQQTKVVAHLLGLQQVRPGVPLRLMGEWGTHAKFGRQFVSYEWRPWAKTPADAEKFLHECVEGFADRDLAKLVAGTFGDDTFEVLSKEPDKVRELAEQGTLLRLALDRATDGWRRVLMAGRLAPLFRDKTLAPTLLRAILAKFGLDAAEVVLTNPYRLLSIEGITFDQADRLAERLGIAKTDPRRLDGAALTVIQSEAQNGHLYVRQGDLSRLFLDMTDAKVLTTFGPGAFAPKILAAVDRLAEREEVKVDPTAGVYLPEHHFYERESAKRLAKFMAPVKLDIDLGSFLLGYERSQQIELSEAQKDAVRLLVKNRVLVLTGLPGTGKTTLVRTFVHLFRQAHLSYALMAPTGIAAKRLASLTNADAATIHRTFHYDGISWHYGFNTKFAVDAVIVDEMSMVDQELFYRVLDSLHPSTMLVLVGDDAQLPSVGPGNVLRELVSCPEVPHVRLTQIFRQAVTSDIVYASHRINQGLNPLEIDRKPDPEFQFVSVDDEITLAGLIVNMAAKLKARNANFQVLSPKYEGTVGVNALNDRLRERLNPDEGQRCWKAGSVLDVREGDRLMVVHNNYKLNVYNGDMCKLTAIERHDLCVRIHGFGENTIETEVRVPKTLAPEILKLAYAVTVHKSQGNEFDTIILPVIRSQGWMLQRNLLYTAVTRARKKVYLLGDVQALLRAVENDAVVQRNTVLARAVSAEIHGVSGVLS